MLFIRLHPDNVWEGGLEGPLFVSPKLIQKNKKQLAIRHPNISCYILYTDTWRTHTCETRNLLFMSSHYINCHTTFDNEKDGELQLYKMFALNHLTTDIIMTKLFKIYFRTGKVSMQPYLGILTSLQNTSVTKNGLLEVKHCGFPVLWDVVSDQSLQSRHCQYLWQADKVHGTF